MAKTGVSDHWKAVVNGSKSGIQSVPKLKEITISKTDLKPFTQYKKLGSEINSVLAKLKDFMEADSQKMIEAGENKRRDDASANQSMKVSKS